MTSTPDMLPPLPPLRHLDHAADLRPTIIVDTREQAPLLFTRMPSVRAGLLTGDYSIVGMEHLFAIERKSIPDLVSCCCNSNRERFENELHRLRGYRFKRLLVVGSVEEIQAGAYRSAITPAAVLGSLSAWEARYDVPVHFCATPEAAARRIETWAWYFAREAISGANGLLRGAAA